MLKVFAYLKIAIGFIVPFALLAESEGKPGPEKRAEVIAKLKSEMESLGLTLPSWFGNFADALIGLLVDVVVEILNRQGFFEHTTELSN